MVAVAGKSAPQTATLTRDTLKWLLSASGRRTRRNPGGWHEVQLERDYCGQISGVLKLECQVLSVSGEPVTLGMDDAYAHDAVLIATGPELTVELKDELDPVVFRHLSGAFAVVMPCRI